MKNVKVIDNGKIKFSKVSIIIFSVALVSILIGYGFLAKGDINIAPVLLVLGYVVLIPLAIMKK